MPAEIYKDITGISNKKMFFFLYKPPNFNYSKQRYV